MFRQIRSKLLAAFAVPLAILVAVVAAEVSLSLRLTSGPKNPHSGVATEALAFAALGLIGAIIGLVLVIRVSRSVSSSLVDLAQQAEKLATETLPDTVQAILESGATGDDLPEVPEIQVDSVDEVAGVASALETLKVTALELAAGQAALRRNLADAFVNLGRRNQNLVTRQLEYITEIELKEADPTSLEELFRLDHLATRMRRNAESLLILAGSGPARQWSASVPVMDVARAASAEVEDYKRLRLHHFDHALVTGAVTTDLVHILAELIENALSFSPPGSPVDVYGRTLDGGYVVVVVDSGIGMSAEDLEVANRRLEGQGSSGEVPGRYLGHFVAGRLAARNGIAISLQSSHSGGLVARVKVPAAVVEEPAPDLSAAAEVRRATRPAVDTAASEIQVSVEPVQHNGAAHETGLAPEAVLAHGGAPALGPGLGQTDLAEPAASVSPPTVPLATVLPAAPSPSAASVPFASQPLVSGALAAAVAGAVYARPDQPEADAPAEITSAAAFPVAPANYLEGANGAVLEPAAEPETDDEPGANPVEAYAPISEGPVSEGPVADGPATDSSEYFDYGADVSLSGSFYNWAGEPGQASNGHVADEPEVGTDGEASDPFASTTVASPAGLNGSSPWQSGIAAPLVQAGIAEPQAEAPQHGEASSETVDEQFEAASDTYLGAEDLPAAAAGAATEHSWDPMLAPKGRLDHEEIQAEEIQAEAVDAGDADARDADAGNADAGEVDAGKAEDGEAERPRPAWVSWDSSFETALEPQPEGPVPSVVSGAAQVGSPSSPARSSSRADELVAAAAVASNSQAWSSSWTSTLGPDAATPPARPQATPAVGPAARARSTADALRKLTRRVPGASLSDEDDSLRRPTPTSTTNNPLGLSGALSQYLSATANESRPQKEHYA